MGAKRKSKAWSFFTKIEPGKAQCELCGKCISYIGGSINNLSRHIRAKHPDIDMNREPKSNPVYVVFCENAENLNNTIETSQALADGSTEISAELVPDSRHVINNSFVASITTEEDGEISRTAHTIEQFEAACSDIIKLNSFPEYIDLASVIKTLETLCPRQFAEPWDNTGLLIEPSKSNKISSILFTIDLTENVLLEALSSKAELIIAFHPPIFSPIKSLKKSNWKDHIVLQCIENSIAVYSPHTACNAIKGGVNDWLISCFDLVFCHPIKQSFHPSSGFTHCINFCIPSYSQLDHVLTTISNTDVTIISSDSETRFLQVLVNKTSLNHVMEILSGSDKVSSLNLTSCDMIPVASAGSGRIGQLKNLKKIEECVNIIKKHLNLKQLRISFAKNRNKESEVHTIAVCAGAGYNILKETSADLFITGEMSHYDLLDLAQRGITVILCEHSNSERGYLKKLMNELRKQLPSVNLRLSSSDKEPISII